MIGLKLAVYGDIHIGRRMPFIIGLEREKAFCETFSEANDKIIGENVDYVFIVGDLFERKTLRPHLIPFVHEELYRIAREHRRRYGKEIKIFLIRGNHDGRPLSDTLNYLKHPLANYLVVIGDEAGSQPFFCNREICVFGLGYYDQIGRAYRERLLPLLRKHGGHEKLKVVLLHAFVEGYHEVPPNSPCLDLHDLEKADVNLVFAGHYHERLHPKKIGEKKWLLMPGSLEVYDVGESLEKGLYIVEIENSDPLFKWVPVEPRHYIKKTEIKGLPAKPPDWFASQTLRVVKDFIEELERRGKKGYLRIVLKGKLSEGLPMDINLNRVMELKSQCKKLLHVEVDSLNLELPPLEVKLESGRINVREFFKGFETIVDEIESMHTKIEDALDEFASPQTGLLRKSLRHEFVEEWLKILRNKKFLEGKKLD